MSASRCCAKRRGTQQARHFCRFPLRLTAVGLKTHLLARQRTFDEDRDFKWNNYLSRYHTRHLDLMDHLAMYTGRANAPLDDLAKLCGFPGKMGVDGSQVWPLYQEGRLQEIRDYCETDVVNTYLVYCRYQLLRGRLTRDAYDAEITLVRTSLQTIDAPHWRDYLSLWQ